MNWDSISLKEIQRMTGHETKDGVRMALRRAGIGAYGFIIGTAKSDWPPHKAYRTEEVWGVFGNRIMDRAKENEEIKTEAWKIFGPQIRHAASAAKARETFGDLL